MIAVVIIIFPLVIQPKSDFGGVDDKAVGIIKELRPNYKPY
jgi:ABC-type cobalt transport system substrate-binding protein